MIDRNREVFDRIERDRLDDYYNNNVGDEADGKYDPWADPDQDYDDSKEFDT